MNSYKNKENIWKTLWFMDLKCYSDREYVPISAVGSWKGWMNVKVETFVGFASCNSLMTIQMSNNSMVSLQLAIQIESSAKYSSQMNFCIVENIRW